MGKEVRRGWLFKAMIQFSGHGFCLEGWQLERVKTGK